MERTTIHLLKDSGFLIAIFTGLSFLCGYAFYDSYFNVFGLPFRLVSIDNIHVLSYGGLLFIPILAGVIISLISKFAINQIWTDMKKFVWVTHSVEPALKKIPVTIYYIVGGIAAFVAIEQAVMFSAEFGRQKGTAYGTVFGPLVEITQKSGVKNKVGLLLISDDSYFLFDPEKVKQGVASITVLNKDEISLLVVLGAVSEYKDS